jgi:hypothetical protein
MHRLLLLTQLVSATLINQRVFAADAKPQDATAGFVFLDPRDYSHHVARFNAADHETVVNLVPNAASWDWIASQAPLFDCPSARFEEIYYFRWWTYRKHFKRTPDGIVLTEFLPPVSHAGPHNTISCAFGHHLSEGRWLRDQQWLDEYARFWFRSGEGGGPAKHFHQFSSWAAAALYERYLVTGDVDLLVELLDDLVADYRQWERERQRPDGLFWQYDVADGMEESISGGRRAKNVRPTINSYMAANARAIAASAALADRPQLAAEFQKKFESLHAAMLQALWDPSAEFFKVRDEAGRLTDVREAIGYIPWTFHLAGCEHAAAWRQVVDIQGFRAPRGLTTAERRHPAFRSHGVGTCEWDGAVWPFATSQTLTGMANFLRSVDADQHEQQYVTRRDFFDELLKYAESHQQNGAAYIGEYHDETTGEWLIKGPKAKRSRHYNHSTFNDLVISGLVGIVPRSNDTVEVDPLIPEAAWDWFCLDGVSYHGRRLTVAWDRTGRRYGKGAGLALWIDGVEAARSPKFGRLTASLSSSKEQSQ